MAGINNYSTLMLSTAQRHNQQAHGGDDDDEDEEETLNARTMPRIIPFPMNDETQPPNYFGSSSHDIACSLRHVNSERDLSLPLDKHKYLQNYYDSQEDEYYYGIVHDTADGKRSFGASNTLTPPTLSVIATSPSTTNDQTKQISMRKYLGIGVQWVSLVTENLLSHPFVVLRRQCQVYNASDRYHLHPIALIPSIIHLHRRQGVTTLWKGLGSCLLVRGLSLAVDDAISKATSWPKEVNSRTPLKRFGQHIILKCISIAVVVPFYAASLVETVQSDIASEKPGLFDVFREGSLRLLYWRSPQKGRMLPVWALIGPSISVGITKHMFSLIVRGISSRILHRRVRQAQERKGAKYRDIELEHQNVDIYLNLVSMLITEVAFFPFETILHRIQLQGTRTIIDNLDNGFAVVPILTNYQGALDCYRTTITTEGVAGLYKGFGAIVLQFAAHFAVIKLTQWVVNQITEVISNRPSTKVMEFYNLDRGGAGDAIDADAISNTTTISPSLSSNDELEED